MSATTPARAETASDHRQRVLRTLVHIQSHLNDDLSLARLARVAHLSEFHFQRVFAGVAGESAAEHVRRLRLDRAAARLRDTLDPIPAIAAGAGHRRVESFSRAFSDRFGVTPALYRRRARAVRGVPATVPPEIRVWVNRPGPGSQLRFRPLPARSIAARSRPPFRIESLWPLRVAFLRCVEPSGAEQENFVRLCGFSQRLGAVSEDPMMLVLRHDDPFVTRREERRIDRCVAIGPRKRGDGDIGTQTIGGGDFAVATHEGPRRLLARSAAWLTRAAAMHGRRRREGPVIEVWLEDPRRPRRSRDVLVDVLIPIEDRTAGAFWYWRRRRPID